MGVLPLECTLTLLRCSNQTPLSGYATDQLPTACRDISITSIGNKCYALGGYNYQPHLNQALYASFDDLLHGCDCGHDSQSAWNSLPNVPVYRPTAGVLAGNLLAVGGREAFAGGAAKKEIYMYSSSTNSWMHVSDLPSPRSIPAVAVLSSTEILLDFSPLEPIKSSFYSQECN